MYTISFYIKVYKMRRRGWAAQKVGQDQGQEEPGQYSKGQFIQENVDLAGINICAVLANARPTDRPTD